MLADKSACEGSATCSRVLPLTRHPVKLTDIPQTCWRACRNRYNNVVLVVMFNVAFPGWLEVQKQLRAAYTPLFRQIVYTGFHRQVNRFKPDAWSRKCCPVHTFILDHCAYPSSMC